MKIVFLNSSHSLPIPSTMGGGAEELLTLLLNENEKSNGENEFYFVQKMLYGQDKKYLPIDNYKHSHLVFVKYNRLLNWIGRALNKVLKILHFKKNTPTVLPTNYHNKALNEIKKINPDLIIFEGQIDANIKKYQKIFGKAKLYMHLHIQDLEKVKMDENVAGIISVSNFVKDDYNAYLGDKANSMNNVVLLNCVNQQRFEKRISNQEREDIRNSLGFSNDDFVVIFVGRISQEKGVIELIEAINKCEKNIKLLIAGGLSSIKKQTSPYIKRVQKLCDENKDRIKFTGYIKNSELYKYYQCADLHVVPSQWEEAAGLVVVEGQMCGVPQIVTKSGGMVEYASDQTIILDKNNDFVNELAKSITSLSKDDLRRQAIAQAGFVNCKKYTKEEYYRNFIDVIGKIKPNR